MTKRPQEALWNQLDRIPIIRDGHIDMEGRGRSLLRRIHLNSSYMISFLASSQLIEASQRTLRVPQDRFIEAQSIVREHVRRYCYIRFTRPEDWVAFYGQLHRTPTYEEAIEYYRRMGDVELAVKSFQKAKRSGLLPDSVASFDERQFRRLQVLEKTLEDFLEFNLELLELGLVFVGRQHPTATGPVDILARDKKKRWIVIELKKGRAAERVIGQLLRYMDFIITEQGSGDPDKVRGFVVASEADKKLVAAARGARKTPLSVFEFSVKGRARRLYPG